MLDGTAYKASGLEGHTFSGAGFVEITTVAAAAAATPLSLANRRPEKIWVFWVATLQSRER